ncbi:MAG: hypothetical protein IKM53_00380, partial [Clostridia bacterium]|nr:hypothetical protein [Clostridia bacterium]
SKYDFIKLHHRLPYGYGVNFTTEKVDFLDDKLNVIVPNFDYIKYNLSFGDYDFTGAYTLEGESVKGDEFMEFHVDEVHLQKTVVELFYKAVEE